jgi:hypothetical protein
MFETLASFNLMEHMGGATFGDADMVYARALSPLRKPYKNMAAKSAYCFTTQISSRLDLVKIRIWPTMFSRHSLTGL